MPRLRRKIYLDDICYIDFDINVLRCYNSKGILKNRNIAPDDRIALKIFCENYKDYVHSYNIFKEIKGKPFEEGIDDPQWISGKISKLRERMRNQKGEDFIQNFGKNNFQLPLKESPFEDDEKKVEHLIAMNKDLQTEIEKLRNELSEQQISSKSSAKSHTPLSTAEFFEQAFSATEELGKVFSIDLALSDAWDLVRNNDYMKKLQEIIDKNVTIRIIVNSTSLRSLASLFEDQMHYYMVGLNDFYHDIDNSYADRWALSLAKLYDIEEKNPRLIQVLPAKFPLLHNIYIVKGDTGNGWVRIKYFTYNNFNYIEDPVLFFKNSDAEYTLYRREFDYIWDFSKKENDAKHLAHPEYADVIRYISDVARTMDLYVDEPLDIDIETGRELMKYITNMNLFDDSYYD
jgi:regulator of replication initiation timing